MGRTRRVVVAVLLVVQLLVLAQASLGLSRRGGKLMVREMSDAYRPRVESLVADVEARGALDEQEQFRAVQDLTFTGAEIANRRTDPTHRSLLISVGLSVGVLILLLWPERRPPAPTTPPPPA